MCERCEVTSNYEVFLYCSSWDKCLNVLREEWLCCQGEVGRGSVCALFVHELFWDGELDAKFKKKR